MCVPHPLVTFPKRHDSPIGKAADNEKYRQNEAKAELHLSNQLQRRLLLKQIRGGNFMPDIGAEWLKGVSPLPHASFLRGDKSITQAFGLRPSKIGHFGEGSLTENQFFVRG